MNRNFLIVSTAALALSLTACGPKAEKAADDAANTAVETADAAGAMASNAMVDVKQAVSATPTAQEFINKAGASDAFEIAAAKLAATNGSSNEVKSFAADMITAHTDSTTKIKTAAGLSSLSPDATLSDDQKEDLADLGKKKGAEFDEAYIDGQIDAHQDALAMVRDYAEHGDNAALKTTAGELAPVIQKHLDHAKSLDK